MKKQVMEISSSSNTRVKTWCKYHQKKYRDQDDKFLIEGEHLVEEAKIAGVLETLVIRKGYEYDFDGECVIADDDVIDKLCQTSSRENLVGICHKIKKTSSSLKRVLLLDDVQDPGNVGTMIRTAYSFGFDAVYVSKGCADLYNEKVIRSTQGALFHIPVIACELRDVIVALQEEGMQVYATALNDAKGLSQFQSSDAVGIVMGNEGKGIHEEIIALCNASICIEMHAFESLNVAVAAGICMYHFRKS